MRKIDSDVDNLEKKVIEFLVPEGMVPKERDKLAKKAGLSPESLRNIVRRKGKMTANSLFRLLIAKGVETQDLAYPKQSNYKKLTKGEVDWIEMGKDLDETEKREFSSLVRYLRSRFDISL
jgi:hypothetical protein